MVLEKNSFFAEYPQTKSLTTGYILVALLSYAFIQLGFALAYTPIIPNEAWGSLALVGTDTDFVKWTKIGLRFYFSLIPLMVSINVGIWWFMRSFHKPALSLTRLLFTSIIGVLVSLPFFYQIPLIMDNIAYNMEFISFEANSLLILQFYFSVLLYLLLLSIVNSNRPIDFSKRLIFNPAFWLFFTTICLFYFFFLTLFLRVFLAGPEMVIYTEWFLFRLGVLPIITIPQALLMPLLLLVFTNSEYFRKIIQVNRKPKRNIPQ